MPKQINIRPSCHLHDAVTGMVHHVAIMGESVQCEFNGVTLIADGNSTVNSIMRHYNDEREKQSQEYYKSDEYKRVLRETEILQHKCRKLLDVFFYDLDFSDLEQVLNWLIEFQECLERVGVTFNSELVVHFFERKGFVESANIGINFNLRDKENFARYIIGQSMAFLRQRGCLHQVLLRFIREWKEMYARH
jgi:hypothetical protein